MTITNIRRVTPRIFIVLLGYLTLQIQIGRAFTSTITATCPPKCNHDHIVHSPCAPVPARRRKFVEFGRIYISTVDEVSLQ